MKVETLLKVALLSVALGGLGGCAQMAARALGTDPASQQKNFEKAMNTEGPVPEYARHAVSFPEAQDILVPAAKQGLTWINPAPTFLKAYPIQNDWDMDRSPSGRVTGRHIRVAVFYKGGQTGYCRFEDTSLQQEEQGGRWGRPSFSGFGSSRLGQAGKRVDCAEVETLPNPKG